ncbi:MAG: FeoA family protein [Vampirovibrionales bacterium]|nr:FeoA family protein [Vampirovibrionales bacterium]
MTVSQVFSRIPTHFNRVVLPLLNNPLTEGMATIKQEESTYQPSAFVSAISLNRAIEGSQVDIIQILDDTLAPQLLRLGIMPGVHLHIIRKTPGGGPIVIQIEDNPQSELAIGQDYARQIQVQQVQAVADSSP